MKKAFDSRLNYTIGNEDYQSDHIALNLQSNDVVICVTGSGDRPLNLLTRECSKLIAIDANPLQNELLRYKMSAMRNLNYVDYIYALGLRNDNNAITREQILDILKNKGDYTPSDSDFQKVLIDGVVYAGIVEKTSKVLAKITSIVIGKKTLDTLFKFTSIADQIVFMESLKRKTRYKIWKSIVHGALNRYTRKLFGDPGLLNIGENISPSDYLITSIENMLQYRLARDSLLLSLFFTGKVYENAFPPYLTNRGFNEIKPRLDKIEIVTGDLVEFLENTTETISCFTLSDTISYMSDEQFERVLVAMIKRAAPNARFILREFMSERVIPEKYARYFHRKENVEVFLNNNDACFLYRFIVGNIVNDDVN